MSNFNYAIAIEAYANRLEDRAQVLPVNKDVTVIAVADGVGGRAGGAAAAEAVMQLALVAAAKSQSGSAPPSASAWCALLESFDRTAASDDMVGETTAVVATLSAGQIQGASVGDSAAWLVGKNQIRDVTAGQSRKPFLGAGQAIVTPFAAPLGADTLLIATDGLFKYADRQTIASLARNTDLDAAAKSLIDAVRLRSGGLQDDVAVVLCRSRSSVT